VDDLTGEFVAETRDTLELVSGALIAWEADPRETSRLDEIFRFVHTVKGSCGFLNLARIEALAHAAETVLGALRDGSRVADARLVSAMLRLIDRISQVTEALESGADTAAPETDIMLITALDSAVTQPETPVESGVLVVKPTRNVRIAVDLLDAMMNQVSDLVLVRNELARTLRTVRGDSEAEMTLGRLSGRVGDLRDSVARARLQPVERLFAALPRLVRDTAADLDKPVQLIVEGSDVELDREMVEQLRDPLIHIVRNAIDHGIETRAGRRAAGKTDVATLRVTARQSGNQIAIDIADDGRGIDIERLRVRAVDAGVIDSRAAAVLSDDDAAQLIFEPGLSTAHQVTAISGRGVGMDIVRSNIEKLGGTIILTNVPGQGLTVELRAPLTLSIVTVLTITAGGQRFAIPRSVVDEVFAIRSEGVRLEAVGSGTIALIRGEALTVVSLAATLSLPLVDPVHLIILRSARGRRWALAVDQLCDHEEVVVRPVAPVIAAAGIFAGQTLPDAGMPLLLIDILGLSRAAKIDFTRLNPALAVAPEPIEAVALLTFTGLDGQRRAIHAHLLDRISDVPVTAFAANGAAMVVSIDNRLHMARVTGPLPLNGTVPMLKLSDGRRVIAYPIAEAHDLVKLPRSEMLATRDGATALIDGIVVPLIDAHDLFGQTGRTAATDQVTIAIASADQRWAQAILAPLIEGAGYRASFDPADPAASILICVNAAPDRSDIPAVRLHDGHGTATAGSIDRYDRRGIEQALDASLMTVRARA
jgi:two-component system, chemotaxis family, sensor kinase CheA